MCYVVIFCTTKLNSLTHFFYIMYKYLIKVNTFVLWQHYTEKVVLYVPKAFVPFSLIYLAVSIVLHYKTGL